MEWTIAVEKIQMKCQKQTKYVWESIKHTLFHAGQPLLCEILILFGFIKYNVFKWKDFMPNFMFSLEMTEKLHSLKKTLDENSYVQVVFVSV